MSGVSIEATQATRHWCMAKVLSPVAFYQWRGSLLHCTSISTSGVGKRHTPLVGSSLAIPKPTRHPNPHTRAHGRTSPNNSSHSRLPLPLSRRACRPLPLPHSSPSRLPFPSFPPPRIDATIRRRLAPSAPLPPHVIVALSRCHCCWLPKPLPSSLFYV
jgi:hypothetical protein